MRSITLFILSLVTLLSFTHLNVNAVNYEYCQSTYQCPIGQVACGKACYVIGQGYTCFNSSLLSIPNSWVDTQIVPTILSQQPPAPISLNYTLNETTCSSANSTTLAVYPGQEVLRSQVLNTPDGISWPTNNNSYYTLVVFDADAPTRSNATSSPLLHYLVINIAGTNISSGKTLQQWAVPSPPVGSGYHRYIWLVFEQGNGTWNSQYTVTSRTNFDWYKFVATKAYTVDVANVTQINASDAPRLSAGTFFQVIGQTDTSAPVWSDYGIVPQIIPYAPANVLDVSFAGSSSIHPGDVMNVSSLATKPNVSFHQANSSDYYTYFIIDPDAPTRTKPTSAPILHYLTINVQGDDFNRGGDILFDYLRPQPPVGSGYHRYTYAVVRQDNGHWDAPDTTAIARAQFQYTAFLQQTSKASGTAYTYAAANFLLSANQNSTSS